jgi:broad specificity phosphatase PhoE
LYNIGKRLKYENIKFDYILCSTAVRTKQTAEIVLKIMNIDTSKLIISDEILEQSQGIWEGMNRALTFTPEIREQMDELHFEFCPPNGESKRIVQKRAIAFLEPIIEQAKKKSIIENREISIVIFTHANLIVSVLQYYLQSNPKYAWLIKQNNTAINEIVLNQHGISVAKVNDHSHLVFSIPETQSELSENQNKENKNS